MKKLLYNPSLKGFTLVELLVAISIIAIVGSVLTFNIQSVQMRSRDAQRKSDLRKLQTALSQYYSDHGKYPIPLPDESKLGDCDANFSSVSGDKYLDNLPCDPYRALVDYNNGDYFYRSDGQHFTLGACLENKNDKAGSDTAPNVPY